MAKETPTIVTETDAIREISKMLKQAVGHSIKWCDFNEVAKDFVKSGNYSSKKSLKKNFQNAISFLVKIVARGDYN